MFLPNICKERYDQKLSNLSKQKKVVSQSKFSTFMYAHGYMANNERNPGVLKLPVILKELEYFHLNLFSLVSVRLK